MSKEVPFELAEIKISTADGVTLFARSWKTAGIPKANIALIHGLGEHSGRYGHVAFSLNKRGFNVHSLDLRGHGRSEGTRCYANKIEEFYTDIDALLEHVRHQDEHAPVFFLGHSMGGLIATLYVLRRQPDIRGLILSAPALKAGDDISTVVIIIARVLGRLFPKLPLQQIDNRTISRDPKVLQDYDADPLNYRGGIRAGVGAAMLNAFDEVEQMREYLNQPLLIMQGANDKLVNPDGGQSLYQAAKSEDKSYRLYDGLYHEIFNEPEQDLVLKELAEWLEARIP